MGLNSRTCTLQHTSSSSLVTARNTTFPELGFSSIPAIVLPRAALTESVDITFLPVWLTMPDSGSPLRCPIFHCEPAALYYTE